MDLESRQKDCQGKEKNIQVCEGHCQNLKYSEWICFLIMQESQGDDTEKYNLQEGGFVKETLQKWILIWNFSLAKLLSSWKWQEWDN